METPIGHAGGDVRRKLGMSLELRGKIMARFGCRQCSTVFNVTGLDKVNQGNIIDRQEQTKGSKNPRRKCHAQRHKPSAVISGSASVTLGDHYWEQRLI